MITRNEEKARRCNERPAIGLNFLGYEGQGSGAGRKRTAVRPVEESTSKLGTTALLLVIRCRCSSCKVLPVGEKLLALAPLLLLMIPLEG